MKRFSKFLTVLLVVSMILPGIAQAAPVVTAESSAVQRLAGKGREETAVAASEMAYKDGAENVVLVGYNGEVDALTGTLLANAKKAPLLITNQASLTETTKKEIARLKAKNVYILGGENVVSEEVEIELKALKYNVKRIEGADREKTAIAVAKEVGGTINHVFLAKGYDIYADALSVGPVSAIKNMPVFLTNTNSMTPATIQAMKDLGVKEVTIVGGEKTVTKKVEDQLKGIKINRISGDDREKTALAVADKFFPSTETSILASGYIFADALVGGYIGAKMNAPILLTNTNLISAETEEFIADNSLKTYVLGGEKVVSDKVLKKIEAAVKAEKASDITVNETIKLNRNYNSVKVTANNIVVDLGGKTVKELTVSANDTTIKNGTVIKLNIEKTVVNVILEDIVDTEDSEHTFAGGGAKSIVLKGNTNLRGLVEVTSTTPIQIRAEGLNAGQGVTGTLIINTGAPVTIGVPVNEVEVQKENTSIKINAEVKKVNALAKTEITMGKDVKAPILEKAKDVEASAKDNNGKVEDFVVNDKLKPTEPVKPVEPTPGGGGVVKVSAISVTPEALTLTVGETGQITATVSPANASNKKVNWSSSDEGVATVDGNGKVTAVGYGIATITVTSAADNTKAATCKVIVANDWSDLADTSWYDDSKNDFTISTAEQLAGLAKLVNEGKSFNGKTITLGANIDLLDLKWIPIGTLEKPFGGNFKGNKKTISNIKIETDYVSCAGLFGAINSGTLIEQVNLDGVYIITTLGEYKDAEAGKAVGALVGRTTYDNTIGRTTIRAIKVTNIDITGAGRVGGIIGWVIDSIPGVDISNVEVQGKITAVFKEDNGDKVGGVVGQVQSKTTVESSSVDVELLGYRDIGGIAGYSANGTYKNNDIKGAIVFNHTGDAQGNVGLVYGRDGSNNTLENNTDLGFIIQQK